jgi:hypothetical protein
MGVVERGRHAEEKNGHIGPNAQQSWSGKNNSLFRILAFQVIFFYTLSMRTTLLVTFIVVVIGAFIGYTHFFADNTGGIGLRECPDQKVINAMPGTEPRPSYYVRNGQRREISEYDAAWVAKNCFVPEETVY